MQSEAKPLQSHVNNYNDHEEFSSSEMMQLKRERASLTIMMAIN